MTEPVPSSPDQPSQIQALPPGTSLRIRRPGGETWEGWLLPRESSSDPEVVHVKLRSGYNVGLRLVPGSEVEVRPGPLWGRTGEPGEAQPGGELPRAGGGPPITLLTTGGTIASRVDYESGGVKPVRDVSGIAGSYPGLLEGGPVAVRSVLDMLSEDIGPREWELLAQEVSQSFHAGARGVVVSHGTDTLAYTAAALQFQLPFLPGPVVLVGAQRSIDRPSSDGVSNLLGATRVAREADLGEVVVVMHAGLGDGPLAIHRATRVRKMHATRRDAFRSLNESPLGGLEGTSGPIRLRPDAKPRSSEPMEIRTGFSPDAALAWVHPGLSLARLERYTQGVRGVVLAATGMGHVPVPLLEWVQRSVREGMFVGVTTQCLEGMVDPYVYVRGRELQRSGATFLGDLSPETAYVKLSWLLHRTSDPELLSRRMAENLAGEISPRREVHEIPESGAP